MTGDLVEQLLHVSPVGICVLTPAGQFVRVNERAEDILGTAREELLDESFREPTWEVRDPEGNSLDDADYPFAIVPRTGEPTFGHEQTLRRADGTRIWVSVSAAPLLADDGEVERVVVTFEDVTAQKATERELRESEQQFRAVFDGTLDALVLADDAGEYLAVNEAACDLYGLAESDLVGRNVTDFAPAGYDVESAWEGFLESGTLRGEFPLVRPDGEVRVTDFAATANVSPGLHLSALRDVTECKADERQLAAQHDELQRLNEVNELIREVNRAIVGATDREAIEAAVCESLVESENYPVAVTTRVTADEEMRAEHVVGLSTAEFELGQGDGSDNVETAIRRTATTNTTTVVTGLPDDTHSAALRDAVATAEIRSIGNVPIEYDDVVYGVLTVAATDDDAFGDREQAVFRELGQLLGKAIDAIQTKKLLYANAYLELELGVFGPTAPLLTLNERVGGTWTVDGIVPVERGRYLLYLDSGETDPAAVVAAAADLGTVESTRVIDARPHRVLELRIAEESAVSALLDAGGRIRSATVEDGVGQFVVDVTPDTDARTYLDRVEQRGIDAALFAKRDVERTVPAAWPDGDGDHRLTARQRTVLEAAHLSGYFDWPRRRTTGEELAASLDIASSTLHQHLRVATAKVLEQYLSVPPAASE